MAGALTQSRMLFKRRPSSISKRTRWALGVGRTIPDLKLSLPLKHRICIGLSYLYPRIVRRVRPLPRVSRTCAVKINSLENPIHVNLLELRKRQIRLRLKRLKRARPAAKLPPS